MVESTRRVLADRYELHEVLGRGGMGAVFRGTDRVLGRTVAVKILTDELSADEQALARFRQEARAAAGLNHPNIVSIFDTGTDGTTPFIVMEYVDGRTLAEVLRTDSPFTVARAVAIATDTVRALQAAHDRGIVHGDIKPGNIMLAANGSVKVMDFGIARAIVDDHHTGFVMGTAAYLSPEQASGGRIDARSDLYSLGCVMFEMLTGRPPFSGGPPLTVAYRQVHEDPIAPSRLRREIPPEIDAVVLRAMAKDRNRRFGSAAEMGDALIRATRPGIAVGDDETAPMALVDRGTHAWRRAAALIWAKWRLLLVLGAAVLVGAVLLVGGLSSLLPRGAGVARPTPTSFAPRTTAPASSSVAEAAASVRREVGAGLTAGDMSRKAADEVLKHVDEAVEKVAEGKPGDAVKKVSEGRNKLIELTDKREVTAARSAAVRGALDDLTAAIERRV